MSKDLDPAIESLFRSVADERTDQSFTDHVMAEVEHRRRRTMIGWGVATLVLLACAWLAMLVLQDALFLVSQLVPDQLVDLGNSIGARLIAPANSVTGLLGIGGLALWLAFRKLF